MESINATIQAWMNDPAMVRNAIWQGGWLIASLALGEILSRFPRRPLDTWIETAAAGWQRRLMNAVRDSLFPACSLLLAVFYFPLAPLLGTNDGGVRIAAILMLAWVGIRLVSAAVGKRDVARMVAAVLWIVAALYLTGLLGKAGVLLDSAAFTLGNNRISALSVLAGLLLLAVFLAVASAASHLVESRIGKVAGVSPSLRVLSGKLVYIALTALAILVALDTIGIDLAALTVLGGALGVGLGFGLQKIVSNFISGIILLADRSIKPGDVIVVGDTYGWVKHLSARYVALITRDGKEHLIPNEVLITERVENWSHTDTNVRSRIPVGVSYDSDVRKALELMLEAAQECPRILNNPPSNALVTGFGDSSVDLELRVWISDPEQGMGNVRSDILLRVWDKFHEHGIAIPYPQRDVHIRTMPNGDAPAG